MQIPVLYIHYFRGIGSGKARAHKIYLVVKCHIRDILLLAQHVSIGTIYNYHNLKMVPRPLHITSIANTSTKAKLLKVSEAQVIDLVVQKPFWFFPAMLSTTKVVL